MEVVPRVSICRLDRFILKSILDIPLEQTQPLFANSSAQQVIKLNIKILQNKANSEATNRPRTDESLQQVR